MFSWAGLPNKLLQTCPEVGKSWYIVDRKVLGMKKGPAHFNVGKSGAGLVNLDPSAQVLDLLLNMQNCDKMSIGLFRSIANGLNLENQPPQRWVSVVAFVKALLLGVAGNGHRPLTSTRNRHMTKLFISSCDHGHLLPQAPPVAGFANVVVP